MSHLNSRNGGYIVLVSAPKYFNLIEDVVLYSKSLESFTINPLFTKNSVAIKSTAAVTSRFTSLLEFSAYTCLDSTLEPSNSVYQVPPPGVDPDLKDAVTPAAKDEVVHAADKPARLYCQETPDVFTGLSPNLPTPLSHAPEIGYA